MPPVPDPDESAKAKAVFAAVLAELRAGTMPAEVLFDHLTALAATVAETATPTLDQDPQALNLLGWWHFHRHEVLSAGEDTTERDRAFRLWEPLLVGAPGALPPEIVRPHNDPEGVDLGNHAGELLSRYERTRQLGVLYEAIALFRVVVAADTPADHPDLGAMLSNLSGALRALFGRLGKMADLDEAVTHLRRAVQVTPTDYPDLGTMLSNLGGALQARFERLGELADLDEAVQTGRRAVQIGPADHPHSGMHLSNLGDSLRVRFGRLGELADLDEAIRTGRRAVQVIPTDHPDLGGYLSNLGTVLQARFERLGEVADLDGAVVHLRRAVQVTPTDHPNSGMYLSNLGDSLRVRFGRLGELADLDEAIRTGRRAVQVTPAGHPGLGAMLSNLGNALYARFGRLGEVADLDAAVVHLRRAVQVTPTDHPNSGMYLSNFGNALQARFERLGELASLDEAVVHLRRAVQACPAGHPDLGMYLSNLGNALQIRFHWTGEMADLDGAVINLHRAVRAAPDGHPNLGMYLSNLGSALQIRFERTGETADLDAAVRTSRRAVQATPDGHPDLGGRLSNLGNALQARFGRLGEMADSDEAVRMSSRAVQVTPAGHPRLGALLSNLGSGLGTRFERTAEMTDLDAAVTNLRRAVQASPADHPDLGGRLVSLGDALRARFERLGEMEVLVECRRCYAAAWAVESGPVDVRVVAARRAADMDLVAGETAHALVMAERAVELLPLLAPRRLQRSDRRHRVTRLKGLASTVAAAALAAGHPNRAVELLEQTRGLMITDTLDTRSDLTTLHHHAPALAAEFTAVRDALDTLDHGIPNPTVLPEAQHREQLLADWEQLLAGIRAIPALTDFLRPPSIHQLRHAARNGPIVYIVAHGHASHALILTNTPDRPVHAVPLPGLAPDVGFQRAAELRVAHHAANRPDIGAQQRSTARSRIHDILAWIWDTITEPVLTHLGHTATPTDDQFWPRLWWCPVSLTTYLPLHAAGHHPTTPADGTTPDGSADTVLDRVVSSYTPTARALRHTHTPTTTPNTLVVAVPDAPHTSALAGVTAEVDRLRELVPGLSVLPAPGDTTTRDAVLAALPGHSIAHFACHGLADWNNPTASRLILHDHHTHPLTLDHITALHLTGAQLAYLSACSTTDTNLDHTDEATHLTAAFHLAGYQAVIGTLWPVNDTAAVTITTAFYQRLTHNGTTPPDVTQTAHALHHATRAHRDAEPQLPDHWAAHIHTGH